VPTFPFKLLQDEDTIAPCGFPLFSATAQFVDAFQISFFFWTITQFEHSASFGD
jgi:hypothetical protein